MVEKLKAASLAIPLTAFVVVTFLLPIGGVITQSVYDDTVASVLPRTASALADWDGKILPDEQTFVALGEEIQRAREDRTLGRVASRINRIQTGTRSLLTKTARNIRSTSSDELYAEILSVDEDWSSLEIWRTIKEATRRYTDRHFLQAVDLQRDANGNIVSVSESNQIYVTLFIRTFLVSLCVTLLCLIIGYPMAFAMAEASERTRRWLLILVLIPFWTSLLVRTSAWIVLLQQQGTLNSVLVWLGLVSDDNRLVMIHNMTGTLIAMTHVLLPFMVLPLYSVMQSIPKDYTRAAAALGANPLQSFYRVYWPQSLPGVGAGTLLVFILSIGYYITPALVGGAQGQLISNLIAFHLQSSLNWGLAAALSTILLLLVFVLYVIFDRVIGVDRLKLG